MDVTESSSAGGSAGGGGSDEPPVVEPLTRNGYKRLASVERQIGEALALGGRELVGRARQWEEGGVDFLSPEALVYFIRRAIRNGDQRIWDDLFRELLERCNPHFRGKFRRFGPEDRQDLQGDVQLGVIEELFAQDDRSDFMKFAAIREFGMKPADAAEHVLLFSGSAERPEPETHVGALVSCPDCRISFDLVPHKRVEG